jgi:transcriptional regulator with XRE-family HTH domain
MVENANAILARLLTEARLVAGLTQVQVAGRLGRPQSFVAKYEKGERTIAAAELAVVALALNTNISKVLEELSRELAASTTRRSHRESTQTEPQE